MRIQRIEPADVDLAMAEKLAALANAENALANVECVPQSAEGLQLRMHHGFDDRPYEGLWVVSDDAEVQIGWASLELPHWDNPQLAFVFCNVDPEARGRGVGSMLLDAQVEAAKGFGRNSLLTFTWKDSHAANFLISNDFAVGQYNAQRRLAPSELDYEHIAGLAASASAMAEDYELVRLDGPAPPEMLPELRVLFEAINDAPLDDVSIEPDVFPIERVKGYDRAMTARHQHVYRLMARHRGTGEWAGHTILCIDETRPGYAVQEDTSVREAHRGHRLGMLLKATMLLWMREAQPHLTKVDTWNATTNSHMIGVNDALGCRVSGLGVALQRSL